MLSPSSSGHLSVMQHCASPHVALLGDVAQMGEHGQYVGGGSELTLGSSHHFSPANMEQHTTACLSIHRVTKSGCPTGFQ